MLGRHGNNLFWMARYLERSENMARRIQAVLHHSLSREDEGRDEVQQRKCLYDRHQESLIKRVAESARERFKTQVEQAI